MRSRLIALLVVAIMPLAANAQQSQAPKDVQNETSKDAPKSYVPGLEQFMNVILVEHNKLWFAGKARNWPLAAYELGEIKEVMSDVQEHVPTFKSLPLADMLDACGAESKCPRHPEIQQRLRRQPARPGRLEQNAPAALRPHVAPRPSIRT